MARFVAGTVVGLAVGLVASAKADIIVTSDIGWLSGWRVKVGGVLVCKDPQVWPRGKNLLKAALDDAQRSGRRSAAWTIRERRGIDTAAQWRIV